MNIVLVIPYKNEALNLRKIFKQIIIQKRKYSEIIFINNNSTDLGPQMVENFIKNYHNSFHYSSNSKYLFDVINLGIKKIKCKNGFVNILSANDYIEKNFIYSASIILNKNQKIGVFTAMGYKKIKNKISKYNSPIISFDKKILKGKSFIKYYKKFGNFFFGPTILYNIKILKKNLFKENLHGISDFINFFKISYFYGVLFYPKRLGIMQIHQGAYLSKTYKYNYFYNVFYFLKKEIVFLNKYDKKFIKQRVVDIFNLKFSTKKNRSLSYLKYAISNPLFSLNYFINRIIKNLFI